MSNQEEDYIEPTTPFDVQMPMEDEAEAEAEEPMTDTMINLDPGSALPLNLQQSEDAMFNVEMPAAEEEEQEPMTSIPLNIDMGMDEPDQPNEPIIEDQEEFQEPEQPAQPEIVINNTDPNFLLQQQVQQLLQQQQALASAQPPQSQPKIAETKKEVMHFHLTQFYNLRKVKYTLEFPDLSMRKLRRAQYIYTLDRKPDEHLKQMIESEKVQAIAKNADTKKWYIDLGVHAKQFEIQEIFERRKNAQGQYENHRLEGEDKITLPKEQPTYGTMQSLRDVRPTMPPENADSAMLKALKKPRWYVKPKLQLQHAKNWLSDKQSDGLLCSRDLNTFDFNTRELQFYMDNGNGQSKNPAHQVIHSRKPELHLRYQKLKIDERPAEEIISQLEPELKICIVVGITPRVEQSKEEDLTDFGIRAIDYKPGVRIANEGYDSSSTQGSEVMSTDPGVCLITDDSVNASLNWLPQLFSTSHEPVGWTMNYIVPKHCTVVSSGKLKRQMDLPSDQTLFTFKLKSDEQIPRFKAGGRLLPPDKIGFAVGHFIKAKVSDLGTAYFLSQSNLDVFKQGFYLSQIEKVVSFLEEFMGQNNECREQRNLQLVYLPNLLGAKSLKPSVNFQGVHVFDQLALHPRNLLEKRHQLFRNLTSTLAHSFFGAGIWEESGVDRWLLNGIRAQLGAIYMRKRCGESFYKYHVSKLMEKYCDGVARGAERFPLTSKLIADPNELSSDIYLIKSQLILHIMERLLHPSNFQKAMRDLYQKGQPTITLKDFKKILPHGTKFNEVQSNWIDMTGCPQLTVTAEIPKKSSQVDLKLEQHSLLKPMLIFKKFVQDRPDPCASGQVIMNQCIETQEQFQKFEVEEQRDAKRWMTSEVKVNVYQTDSIDIIEQVQKMRLKQAETKMRMQFNLQVKTKKGVGRKNAHDGLNEYVKMAVQLEDTERAGGSKFTKRQQKSTACRQAAEQALIDENNQWRFDLSEHEYEEFDNDHETKNLFRNNECPILWLRVDTDLEMLRRVKVNQPKVNWLFQLLREKDYLGQIEACKELGQFSDQLVYDILSSVVKNDKYFFKVRKHALKALQRIDMRVMSENARYHSREESLLKFYDQRNYYERIGFYKSNDFRNTLEYYVDKYLVEVLSRSKEQAHKYRSMAHGDRDKAYQKMQDDVDMLLRRRVMMQGDLKMVHMELPVKEGLPVRTEVPILKDEKSTVIEANTLTQEQRFSDLDRQQAFARTTTDAVSTLLLRLLQQNDNIDNPFDDAYWLKNILEALGRCDDFSKLSIILNEVEKYLKIDTGPRSVHGAVSKGAISCFFGLKKSMWRYKHLKKPFFVQDVYGEYLEDQNVQQTIQRIEKRISAIMNDRKVSLDLRLFVFKKLVKNKFQYQSEPICQQFELAIPRDFWQPFYELICMAESSRRDCYDFSFAAKQILILAEYLEANKLKLNYLKTFESIPDGDACKITSALFDLMLQEPCNLPHSLPVAVRRLYAALFGSTVPQPLKFLQDRMMIQPNHVEFMIQWSKTEQAQEKEVELEHVPIVNMNRFENHFSQETVNLDFLQKQFAQPNIQQLNLPQDPILNVNMSMLAVQPTIQIPQVLEQREEIQFQDDLNDAIKITNDEPVDDINIALNDEEMQDEGDEAVVELKIDGNYDEDEELESQRAQSEGEVEFPVTRDNWFKHHRRIRAKAGFTDAMSDVDGIEGVEEHDDFDDYLFTGWRQACKDILYLLYYDEDATDFIEELNEEKLGDLWDDYLKTVPEPICFNQIKHRLFLGKNYTGSERHYRDAHGFIRDMHLVIQNCKAFNSKKSELYRRAKKVGKMLFKLEDELTVQLNMPE